jgi:putative transposase
MAQSPTHCTAKKLAGLPGMPSSVKQVIEWGNQGKIASRPVKKQDGSLSKFREYAIASLPDETRAALATANTKVGYAEAPVVKTAARHAKALKQSADEAERQRQAARAQSMLDFGRLPLAKQQGANAKLAIILAYRSYIADHRLAKTLGAQTFCHEYTLDRIDVAPWVRNEIPSLHPATLRGWIRDEYEFGMMALVDVYGNRKDQSKIETWNRLSLPDGTVRAPMADTIETIILKYPWITEKKCNEALRAILPDAVTVSNKSVMRFMNKWKEQNAQRYALACNPDDYKNRYQPAFGSRSEDITGPNQRWEIDATPADILATDARYKIIGVTDVGCARLKLYATRTERTRDNAFAMRRCLLEWGVPYPGGEVRTDQGSAYDNPQFSGLMHDLDIRQHICNPFSGDEKPHIERAFHTFSHDLVELLPGYCGHDVSQRKAIEAQKSFAQRLKDPSAVIEINMTGEELQAFCDRWCDAYHNTKHSRLGMTPNQAFARWAQPIRTITDERILDVLLYEPVRRGGRLPHIGKKGIRIDNSFYIHELLEAHMGERCRAFQDPLNLGRIIVNVLNRQGVWEFLCIAIDPEREPDGISREEVARASRHLHSEHKKEMQRLTNAAKRELKGVNLVDAVLTMREREAAEAQGNVVPFPKQTVPHESAGLVAAAAAFAALDRTEPEPVDQLGADAIEAAGQRWIELTESREKEGKVVPLPTAARPMFGSDHEKYTWLQANPHLQAFDDARWIGWYEHTTEYQLMFGQMEEEQGF